MSRAPAVAPPSASAFARAPPPPSSPLSPHNRTRVWMDSQQQQQPPPPSPWRDRAAPYMMSSATARFPVVATCAVASAGSNRDIRVLSAVSPVRVDAMDWPVSSSPTDEQHSPRRLIPFSVLLNPSDDDQKEIDGDDEGRGEQLRYAAAAQSPVPSSSGSENATATATVPVAATAMVPQPKRRGRKPHLPQMNNSERGKYYRNKRKRYGDALTGDVGDLREQMERLRTMRDICCDLSISTRMSLPGSLAKLVREYFVQFRHGVQLPPSRRNMALADVEISTTQQNLFMSATMEPDVGFGEYRGINTVMDQWERYSQYHALLVFELLSVHITGPENAPVIFTRGQLRTRYSRKTIENVFPHVVGNEPLIQRLIGKEIVYPCQNQFYFTEEGRVQRYDVEADFVSAMVTALGNTEDAALLLGQALIQQQHMMGVLDDQGEDKDCRVSAQSDTVVNGSPGLEVEYLVDGDDADPDAQFSGLAL